MCHCGHVTKLMEDMRTVQQDITRLQTARAPLIPPAQAPPGDGAAPPASSFPGATPDTNGDAAGNLTIPLKLGPLGALATNRVFDDKISTSPEFKFNGHSGGDDWRNKVQRYMISKVPALSTILMWAEREEQKIDMARLSTAVGYGLAVTDNHGFETEYTAQLDSAIWGFLSNCISG